MPCGASNCFYHTAYVLKHYLIARLINLGKSASAKMGRDDCTATALQEFQHPDYPEILEPVLSSLDKSLNVRFVSDQSQSCTSEINVQSDTCQQVRGSPQQQQYNEHDSSSSFKCRRTKHDFVQVNDSPASASFLRRGTSSRRISGRQSEPNDLTLILELLPCIAGLLWIANVYFGIL